MKFVYKGIELSSGQRVEGELDAASYQEATKFLKDKRIEALSVNPLTVKKVRGRNVVEADLVVPLQELATLTGSGVALIDALKALAADKTHPNLANGFMQIAAKVEGGDSFSDAIDVSALPFPPYVSHLVKAGELGGQLAQALMNASEQLNYEQSIKSDLKSALTYPMVLIGTGVVAMLIIFFAVVPKFSHLLEGDKELPMLANAVLISGEYANQNPLLLGGIFAFTILVIVVVASNASVRAAALNLALELPVVGPWLAEQDAARWSSLCAAMLMARVSLVAALKLAANSCSFTKRKQRALTMVQDVESGISFTEALERSRLVPSTSLNLVSVGDKTGQLAEMLEAVAKLHDASCKRKMKQVMTLMEPAAILVVGILIGIMILGIVQAITASTDIAI